MSLLRKFIPKTSRGDYGAFSHAHDFVIQHAALQDIRINTQNIYNHPNPTDEPLSPIQMIAPSTSRNFIGQESYLERLREYFSPNNISDTQKIFLLHGMGGIGKTQICSKFADETSGRFDYIFWIDTTTENTVLQGLKEVYKRLSPTGTSSASFSVPVVLNSLSALQSEWLIIYDNADGPHELVEKFLPPGNKGNILITSRNPGLRRVSTHRNSMEVSEMKEESAVKLLLKTSGLKIHNENDIAKEIVQMLHYLPLAIDMAGAYISQVQCTMHDFIRLYDKHRPKILNHEKFKGVSGYSKTVYKTLEISFQKILEMSNNQENEEVASAAKYAMVIVNTCAFLHHDNIPGTMFRRAAENFPLHMAKYLRHNLPSYFPSLDQSILNMNDSGEWDEWLFNESTELLLSFSLIKKSLAKSMFSFHPLVQSCCQDRLPANKKELWIMDARALILSSVSPSIDNWTTEEYLYQNYVMPHIMRNLSHSIDDVNNTTWYNDISNILADVLMMNCGPYELEAKFRFRIALKYLETITGASSENINESFTLLEKKFFSTENEVHSQDNYNLISIAEVLSALYRLSNACWNKGDRTTGNELGVIVLKMQKKLHGSDHVDTLRSMESVAFSYADAGKIKDAEQLRIEVLSARKRLLGNEHPETLWSMHNLAISYKNQGMYEEAIQIEAEVLDARKRILGIDHPDTLASMRNLAFSYKYLFKDLEAEQLEIEALDMSKRILGNEHPDTLWNMTDLAVTYKNLQKYEKAEQLEIEVLDLRKRNLGNDHPDTLWSMSNISMLYQRLGRCAEAEKLEMEVLNGRKKVLGNEHPDTLFSMANIAILCKDTGRYEEAENRKAEVLEIRRKILGNHHPDTIWSMGALAVSHRDLGKHEQAKQLQIEVLNVQKKILGNENPYTVESMFQLAITYHHLEDYQAAKQLEIEILNFRRKALGKDHPDTLIALDNLVITCRNLGKDKEAEDLKKRYMN